MRYVHALVLLLITIARADGEQQKDAELETIDAANRTVKFVGAGYTRTRKHNLVARFVEVRPNQGSEIRLGFEPSEAETTVQRSHASTISSIIFWSDPYKLHEPKFEVIFSIPKDAQGMVSDFDRWFLVSIKPLEAKKEPPKDAVNAMAGYGEMPGAGEMPIIAGPQHRAVQLVGVRFSESRRHDLLAKFAELVPQHGAGMGPIRLQKGREIELGMGGPIRSTRDQTIADVTHTRTILNIIESSVSSPRIPNPRIDASQWRKPLFEVIFSIPQDAKGSVTDFTRWSLLSIKLSNAKKEQPKPADK